MMRASIRRASDADLGRLRDSSPPGSVYSVAERLTLMLPDALTLPRLETPRLSLRWLVESDVPALFGIFGDPVVCRYWSRPALMDREAAAGLLQEIHAAFASRTLFQWGITVRPNDDEVIGTCTLAALSQEHRRAEVGFALARAHWGGGYTSEALARLITFAFDDLALNRLEADVDPRHAASIRVLEKVGFRREGLARERYWMNGEFQDAVTYGLLRSERHPPSTD